MSTINNAVTVASATNIAPTASPSIAKPVTESTTGAPLSAAQIEQDDGREYVAHLSDYQRFGLLEQICRAVADGQVPRLSAAANISVLELLRTFRWDRHPAAKLSMMLGLQHEANRFELASSLAGRLGYKF